MKVPTAPSFDSRAACLCNFVKLVNSNRIYKYNEIFIRNCVNEIGFFENGIKFFSLFNTVRTSPRVHEQGLIKSQ